MISSTGGRVLPSPAFDADVFSLYLSHTWWFCVPTVSETFQFTYGTGLAAITVWDTINSNSLEYCCYFSYFLFLQNFPKWRNLTKCIYFLTTVSHEQRFARLVDQLHFNDVMHLEVYLCSIPLQVWLPTNLGCILRRLSYGSLLILYGFVYYQAKHSKGKPTLRQLRPLRATSTCFSG